VYLSHDPFYGRDVAIKLYHSTSADDAESRNARRMFMGEAHMIGKLHHPNIVPIYDAGEEEGRRYVVTEHIHGARTLSAYCRPGSLLPIDQVVQIVYKCAKALHYAHSRGVVHRDIKPSNILLTQDGDVRIVDSASRWCPTPRSRASRAWRQPGLHVARASAGHPLDSRSDLYSLGASCTRCCAASGRSAPARSASCCARWCSRRPSRCATCAPRSGELGAIVARALQKNPDDRFRTGAEFAAALTRVHQRLRSVQPAFDEEERFACCAGCASSTTSRTPRSAR